MTLGYALLENAVQCVPAEVQLEQAGYWVQQEQLQTEQVASGVEPYVRKQQEEKEP